MVMGERSTPGRVRGASRRDFRYQTNEPAHNPRAHGGPPTVAPFRAWRGSATPRRPRILGRLFSATPPARAPSTNARGLVLLLAERVGFEPTVPFPVHTISSRAS